MRRLLSIVAVISVLVNVLLVALLVYLYTSVSAGKASTMTPVASPTMTMAPVASPTTSNAQGMQQAVAQLVHAPGGTALLKWDPTTKKITVTTTMSGLLPKSKHASHIHQGDCTSVGNVVQPLTELSADENGNATATTTLSNTYQNGLPNGNWAIRVHNGPESGTGTNDQIVLSCGELPTTEKTVQQMYVPLGTAPTNSQSAFGESSLSIENGSMTVVLNVHGLEPNSKHAAHIHAGSCQMQAPGNAIHPITTLTADGRGNASSVTVLPNVTQIPAQGWYINVHRTEKVGSPTDTDPILCGNVVAAQPQK
ncbi:MAG: CHRD domain-containing protein [Ktedonobacteraceae bacterium]|nr:CHRD domain-containing protein [Ktedonobacteraceae bacterium]